MESPPLRCHCVWTALKRNNLLRHVKACGIKHLTVPSLFPFSQFSFHPYEYVLYFYMLIFNLFTCYFHLDISVFSFIDQCYELGHWLNWKAEMATFFYDMKDRLLKESFVSHSKYLGLPVCFISRTSHDIITHYPWNGIQAAQKDKKKKGKRKKSTRNKIHLIFTSKYVKSSSENI